MRAVVGARTVGGVSSATKHQLDPARPIALLGLGRNARLLARDLSKLGRTILGVDSGVHDSPWWSDVDRVPVRMFASPAELPSDAQLVMTVLKDDRFLDIVKTALPGTNVLQHPRRRFSRNAAEIDQHHLTARSQRAVN